MAVQARRLQEQRVHLRLLEHLGPPSVLVNRDHDILHLSPSAGRFLQMSGGEPSRNLLRSVDPAGPSSTAPDGPIVRSSPPGGTREHAPATTGEAVPDALLDYLFSPEFGAEPVSETRR